MIIDRELSKLILPIILKTLIRNYFSSIAIFFVISLRFSPLYLHSHMHNKKEEVQ